MHQVLIATFTFVKYIMPLLKWRKDLPSCGQWRPVRKCARGIRLHEYF